MVFLEVVFVSGGAPSGGNFCFADKAIFRSNPWWIARESNAVCEQKGRSGGVQCLRERLLLQHLLSYSIRSKISSLRSMPPSLSAGPRER